MLLNRLAQEAFDATVNEFAVQPQELYRHARQYMVVKPRTSRAHNVFSNDSGSDTELHSGQSNPQWDGYYKFSLRLPPREPSEGWWLGTSRTNRAVDILLAPPGPLWERWDLAGKHACLFFHFQSCRIILKARHKLIITAASGPIVYAKPESRVLESKQVVSIGDCLYEFSHTAHLASASFKDELVAHMKFVCGPQWTAHALVSPASSEGRLTIGDYACLPGTFAQGSFGEITSGWASDGTAVAIKRFKVPKKEYL